jgi:metal transporter CNNM
METLVWLGIAFCASQSALFSGLNLAVFGISRLRLETEAATGRVEAMRLLELRQDSNFLLTTVLWGNVGINVLLALLSNSVMAGLYAFLFSTVVITFLGEIFPQAYFVRHAMRMGSLLVPLLRFYQFVLYPVAKPTALLLDRMLGPEAIEYLREAGLKELLQRHADASEAREVSRIEGVGAANFLALDDVHLAQEGERVDPRSVLAMPFSDGLPVFPAVRPDPSDPFLQLVQASGRKWVVLTDDSDEPRMVMDSDAFLRDALFHPPGFRPLAHCHRPILSRDPGQQIGALLPHLHVRPTGPDDDVVDHDIVLLWGEERRVITGSDILGRLLRGIARVEAEA